MASSPIPAGGRGARVTFERAASETYASALTLARAFGATVFEPSWWPADAEEVSYCLVRFPNRADFEIQSTRCNGVPVGVIGHVVAAEDRSPREWLNGQWSEPGELAHVRGLIGRVGVPPSLQAVIYDQRLEVHLIGYNNEDEITSAVRSLGRVRPD